MQYEAGRGESYEMFLERMTEFTEWVSKPRGVLLLAASFTQTYAQEANKTAETAGRLAKVFVSRFQEIVKNLRDVSILPEPTPEPAPQDSLYVADEDVGFGSVEPSPLPELDMDQLIPPRPTAEPSLPEPDFAEAPPTVGKGLEARLRYDRRRESRLPAVNIRVLLDESLRELPVRDVTSAGMGVEHMGWRFDIGKRLHFDVIDGYRIMFKGVTAAVVRVDPEVIGLRFEAMENDDVGRMCRLLAKRGSEPKREEPVVGRNIIEI